MPILVVCENLESSPVRLEVALGMRKLVAVRN